MTDELPIVLMDRNETMFAVREVAIFYTTEETRKDRVASFAALLFEPLAVINKKIVSSGQLDDYEDILRRATGLGKIRTRAAMSFLNEHNYYMITLDELGQLRKEATEYSIVQAQNAELNEHIAGQNERIEDLEKHVDELLGMIPRN